jgi:two-component system phosphate regulon sensor histidine kinase PhoR
MYAEMLENNWLTSKEKTAEYYRNMRQESERLSRLIENVLDFSRLQRGRKRYDFRLGDVNQCVGEVVAMMRPYASQHGFSIETDFADVGQCSFDRDAVAQIVVNLLDNAIKYARSAADKTIRVRTRCDAGYTIMDVEDHGPGVPHRQRTKIFEQFYRGTSETPARDSGTASHQTTGTGLGLALVKRFAEAHHGFVEILSADPGRTVFRVGLAARN